MKYKLLANGLSKRANNLLTKAGIFIEKEAIIHALQTGKLYAYCWPPNYGPATHSEVCQWAGVDPTTLPQTWPNTDATIFPDIGISYRSWRTLIRAGIPTTKKAVRRALQTGALSPNKRPSNYGLFTHTEICRWVGMSPKARPRIKSRG